MSARDREFAMTPGFVTSTTPLMVRTAGAATPAQAVLLGGGTPSIDDLVFTFHAAIGNKSKLCAMVVT